MNYSHILHQGLKEYISGIKMTKLYQLFVLIFAVLIQLGCTSRKIQHAPDVSLDEMIGQMILVGFRGLEVSEDSVVAQEIRAGKVGGIILFNRDVALGSSVRNIQSPEQLTRLNAQLQSFAKIPLLISVDQEGGKVVRLRADAGFPVSVSQQYLGAIDNLDSTKFYVSRMAKVLHQCGFNVNFSPSVDVNVNPTSPAIGAIGRSFSADTLIVAKHADVVIEEQKTEKIFSALKHFPGHGSAGADSHLGLTDVSNTWSVAELFPYRKLIADGKADIIMTAHIFNSHLDNEYPATLSNKIITGILRRQLGYKGVVITDDMNMKAIADYYSLEKAIELSINAGVDIMLMANNLHYDKNIGTKTFEIIKKLVTEGKITEARIRESYDRIMLLKSQL